MQSHTGKLKLSLYYQNTLNFISLNKKVGKKFIPTNEFLAKLEAKLKFFQFFIFSVVKEVMWIVLVFFIFIYFVRLPAVHSHSLYMIEQSPREIVLYLISDSHSNLIHSGKKYCVSL